MSADAPDRGSVKQPATKVAASFPRSARLLKHSDFERVYKQGRRHFSPHMTFFYLERAAEARSGVARDSAHNSAQDAALAEAVASNEKCVRIGFTVGRVLGGAVQRNRIKRRLREAVRLRRAALKGALDVVINPKKSVLTLEFSVLVDEVGRALESIAKKRVAVK